MFGFDETVLYVGDHNVLVFPLDIGQEKGGIARVRPVLGRVIAVWGVVVTRVLYIRVATQPTQSW